MKKITFITSVFFAGIVTISSCVSQTKPTQFFTLSPATTFEVDLQRGASYAIAIGPVELPDHLDRPQMVTRLGDHELHVSEFNHWAGSLKRDFTQTLLENISLMLNIDQVYIYPIRYSLNIDYQITVQTLRFDGYLGGEVSLLAIWTVLTDDGRQTLITKKSVIIEQTKGDGYDDLAKAQSVALEKLSRQIAEVISKDRVR